VGERCGHCHVDGGRGFCERVRFGGREVFVVRSGYELDGCAQPVGARERGESGAGGAHLGRQGRVERLETSGIAGRSCYRYDAAPDRARLEQDLVTLAINGYRFYDACINRLAGGFEQARRLQVIMRRPAHIQISATRNPRLLLPAALFL
jgi:hypothetical protein